MTAATATRALAHKGARRYLAVILAAVLVLMLAGHRPVSADTPAAHAPAVTEVIHDMQPAGAGTIACDIFLFGACTIANAVSSWAGDTISGVGSDLLTSIVDALCTATENMAFAMYTWWLYWPSIDIESMGLGTYYDWMYGIGVLIATLLLMSQALKTIVARKGTPLLHGLQGVVRMTIWSTAGLGLVDSLLKASDWLTDWLSLNFILGNLTQNPAEAFAKLITPQTSIGVMAAFMLSIVAFISSLLMLLMLIVRQAALPIQAMLIPIAAAGLVGDGGTKDWHNRLWTAILACVCYKPLAMLVVVIGFTEVNSSATAGSVKNDIYNVVVGIVTLVLAALAMPALLRLFSPVVSTATSGGGLASGLSSMAGMARGMFDGGGKGDGPGPTSAAQLVQQAASQTNQSADPGQGQAESKPSPVANATSGNSGPSTGDAGTTTNTTAGTGASQGAAAGATGTAQSAAAGATAGTGAAAGATAAAGVAVPPLAALQVAKVATDAAKNAATSAINEAADGGTSK